MKEAKEGEEFHLNEGGAIRNLDELKAALEQMSQEQFMHHVHDEENHFADWVENVIEDEKLANVLRNMDTAAQMAEMIKIREEGLQKKEEIVEKKEEQPKIQVVHEKPKTGKHKKDPHWSKEHFVGNLREFAIGVVVGLIAGIMLVRVIS